VLVKYGGPYAARSPHFHIQTIYRMILSPCLQHIIVFIYCLGPLRRSIPPETQEKVLLRRKMFLDVSND